LSTAFGEINRLTGCHILFENHRISDESSRICRLNR